MKNRDVREIQLSSSQLVFIFLGILVLGVVIFLLGVSVGKKQAQIAQKAETITPAEAEQPKEKTAVPASEPKDSISEELASHQKVMEETQKKTPLTEKKSLYYIQVGAFNNKEPALSFAEQFRKKGYNAIVLDPLPTDRKQIFRVRVGGFETQEKAEEVKTKLISEAKRKVDYFITRS